MTQKEFFKKLGTYRRGVKEGKTLEPLRKELLQYIAENYYNYFKNICRKRFPSEEEAVDSISQEVFVSLSKYLHSSKADNEPQFKSWLFIITQNQINSYFADKGRRDMVKVIDFEILEREAGTDSSKLREEDYFRWTKGWYYVDICDDYEVKVEPIKEGLKQEEWQVIKRYIMGDKDSSEVADELGISIGNIRTIASRATEKIKLEWSLWKWSEKEKNRKKLEAVFESYQAYLDSKDNPDGKNLPNIYSLSENKANCIKARYYNRHNISDIAQEFNMDGPKILSHCHNGMKNVFEGLTDQKYLDWVSQENNQEILSQVLQDPEQFEIDAKILQCLSLRYIEKKNFDEISQEENIIESKVRREVLEAMKEIKKFIDMEE